MASATEILEIIIEGKDRASGEFNKAGSALSKLGAIGKGVLTVGLAAGAAAATALGAGLVIAIGDAMEAERVIAQLDAVLASTGGTAGVTREAALDLANAFEKTTKFSAEQTLSAENLLLTFTNIGSNVFPRATESLLDMATALGTDASGSAIQLGKALNDPVAGITALTRVGVSFTEEQKNMITALVESGDLMGAQTIILDELEKEFGGSAEAAGQTFGGQLEILKNALGAVIEPIGAALLPLLTDLAGFITSDVLPVLQGVGEGFGRLLGIVTDQGWGALFTVFEDGSSWLGTFFETIGLGEVQAQALMQWAKDIKVDFDNFLLALQPVFDAFQNLANAFIESIPLMQAQGAAFQTWFSEAFGITFPTLIANFTGIINGLAELWREHGDTVMGVVDAFMRTIIVTIGGALTLISGIVNAALLLLQGDWQGALDVMQNTLNTFFESVLSLVGTNGAEFNETWRGTFELAKIIWDTWSSEVSTAWNTFWDTLILDVSTAMLNFLGTWQSNWDAFQLIIETVIGNILGFFSDLKQTIQGMISDVQGLIEKILSIPGIPGGGDTGGGSTNGGFLVAGGSTASPIGTSGNDIDRIRARIAYLLTIPLDEGGANELNGLLIQLEQLTNGGSTTFGGTFGDGSPSTFGGFSPGGRGGVGLPGTGSGYQMAGGGTLVQVFLDGKEIAAQILTGNLSEIELQKQMARSYA